MKITQDGYKFSIDGVPVPGITTITGLLPKKLDKWIIKITLNSVEEWLEDMEISGVGWAEARVSAEGATKRITDASKEIGIKLHSVLEGYIKAKLLNAEYICNLQEESICLMFEQFLKWEAEKKPKWIASELLTGHKDLGYVAIIDAVAEIDGELNIIDFKTSNYLNYEHYLQLTGEVLSYMKMRDMPRLSYQGIKRRILKFPKDGGPIQDKIVDSNFEMDYETLFNLCALYKNLEISKSYFPQYGRR